MRIAVEDCLEQLRILYPDYNFSAESKVKLFKDGCDFDVGDLNIIMSELNALGAWATENLSGIDLKYMSERIENLKSVLPQACKCKGGKFYIF